MGKLIDVDQFLSDESEAYKSAQNQIADEKLIVLNELVHKKMQMLIADIPTVDAVPVVHGYWIEDNKWSLPKCSICRKRSHSSVWHDEDNFCGHCGAKMDGERKEE